MMTMFSKLKLSSRSVYVSRNFHAGAVIKNLNDNSDTKHLFKKKYEFIKKQHLEDSFKDIKSNNLNKSNYINGSESKKSDSDIDKTLEMTQKFKSIALGIIALGFTIGSIQVYLNWNWVQSKIYGDNFDAESFDEMYERVKDKKYKKIEKIDQFSTTITNPNNTSVPGVYICGNNSSHLASDNLEIPYQPFFKRLDFFDNFTVKDLKLSDTSGALINDKGDLYQWGKGFGGDQTKPTIKGKKLVNLEFSNGVIYALTNRGEILYIPENFKLQETINNKKKGWLGSYNVHYFKLRTPKPIASFSAGLQHIVLLTKDGSVYTSATGYNTKIEKSYGQFGLPEFSQFDEPPKINEVYEVTLLNKYIENGQILKRKIKQIATGDVFTLCLDSLGSVWAFGKNTYGSVGKVIDYDTEIVPYPTKIHLINNNFKKTEFPQCINIAAGGDTAFATYVSSNIYHLFEKSLKSNDLSFSFKDLSESQQDSLVHFAWGHGLKGELGLGYFIHGIYEPRKIKNLNNIKEFNEATQKLETTGIKSWSVGKNHIAVTLTNNDVYVWGDNEYGQLGNGKRIRLSMPSTVPSILEPGSSKKKNKYAKYNDRLHLLDTGKFHQVIVAGRDTTAIYYKKD